MAILLKVNTDIMQSIASEMEKEVQTIENNFRDIQSIMVNTGNYWKGDAADADRKSFTRLQEQIDELVKSLRRQPVKLCEIAGIMIETEQNNTSMAMMLTKEDFV